MNNIIKPSKGATASLCSKFGDANHYSNGSRPPFKLETVLLTFLERGKKGMNQIEAISHYGDTCLNTSVSQLERKLGIYFKHETESIRNRVGTFSPFTRYTVLTEKDELKAKWQINKFRVKRDLSPIQWGVSA